MEFKVWVSSTETAGLLAGGQAGSDQHHHQVGKGVVHKCSPEINVNQYNVQGVAQQDGDSWTACWNQVKFIHYMINFIQWYLTWGASWFRLVSLIQQCPQVTLWPIDFESQIKVSGSLISHPHTCVGEGKVEGLSTVGCPQGAQKTSCQWSSHTILEDSPRLSRGWRGAAPWRTGPARTGCWPSPWTHLSDRGKSWQSTLYFGRFIEYSEIHHQSTQNQKCSQFCSWYSRGSKVCGGDSEDEEVRSRVPDTGAGQLVGHPEIHNFLKL